MIVGRFLKNLLLSIVSLFLCLLIFEGAFRLISMSTLKAHWQDRPLYYYNLQGSPSLRAIKNETAKSPQAFRIAVVGDSFSFAPFMQYDDAFPVRLERMLNQNQTDRRAEVINYGVPGYSTSHEVQEVAKAIKNGADLVILQVTLNDCQRKPLTPTGISILNNPFAALEITEATHPILSKWKSLAFIVSRIHDKMAENTYRDYHLKLWEKQRDIQLFEASVRKIARICASKHIPLLAVTFPLFGYPLDKSYPFRKIHSYIDNTLTKYNIPNLDLLQSFSGAPYERLVVIPGKDFHPNEIAHRIAAEELYIFLTERLKLIPDELKISELYRSRTQIMLAPHLKLNSSELKSRAVEYPVQ